MSTIVVPHLGPSTANAAQIATIRQPLLRASIVQLVGGICCICTFWAVYYLGLVLAATAIIGATILIVHTRSSKDVKENNCCCSSYGAFKQLAIIEIVNGLFGVIGMIICLISIFNHKDDTLKLVAVFGFIGCLTVCVAGFFCQRKCLMLNTLIKNTVPIVPVVMRTHAPIQGQALSVDQPPPMGPADSGNGVAYDDGTSGGAYAMTHEQQEIQTGDVGYGAATGYGQPKTVATDDVTQENSNPR